MARLAERKRIKRMEKLVLRWRENQSMTCHIIIIFIHASFDWSRAWNDLRMKIRQKPGWINFGPASGYSNSYFYYWYLCGHAVLAARTLYNLWHETSMRTINRLQMTVTHSPELQNNK